MLTVSPTTEPARPTTAFETSPLLASFRYPCELLPSFLPPIAILSESVLGPLFVVYTHVGFCCLLYVPPLHPSVFQRLFSHFLRPFPSYEIGLPPPFVPSYPMNMSISFICLLSARSPLYLVPYYSFSLIRLSTISETAPPSALYLIMHRLFSTTLSFPHAFFSLISLRVRSDLTVLIVGSASAFI